MKKTLILIILVMIFAAGSVFAQAASNKVNGTSDNYNGKEKINAKITELNKYKDSFPEEIKNLIESTVNEVNPVLEKNDTAGMAEAYKKLENCDAIVRYYVGAKTQKNQINTPAEMPFCGSFQDGNTKFYTDKGNFYPNNYSYDVSMAKGERKSFQFVISAWQDIPSLTVRLKGDKIAPYTQMGEVFDVNTSESSFKYDYGIEKINGLVLNLSSNNEVKIDGMKAGETRSVWITVDLKDFISSGDCASKIIVDTGGTSVSYPLNLKVWNFAINTAPDYAIPMSDLGISLGVATGSITRMTADSSGYKNYTDHLFNGSPASNKAFEYLVLGDVIQKPITDKNLNTLSSDNPISNIEFYKSHIIKDIDIRFRSQSMHGTTYEISSPLAYYRAVGNMSRYLLGKRITTARVDIGSLEPWINMTANEYGKWSANTSVLTTTLKAIYSAGIKEVILSAYPFGIDDVNRYEVYAKAIGKMIQENGFNNLYVTVYANTDSENREAFERYMSELKNNGIKMLVFASDKEMAGIAAPYADILAVDFNLKKEGIFAKKTIAGVCSYTDISKLTKPRQAAWDIYNSKYDRYICYATDGSTQLINPFVLSANADTFSVYPSSSTIPDFKNSTSMGMESTVDGITDILYIQKMQEVINKLKSNHKVKDAVAGESIIAEFQKNILSRHGMLISPANYEKIRHDMGVFINLNI